MNYINQSEPKKNHLIRDGDVCVIYISEHNKNILKINKNSSLQTKFGLVEAASLIGHPFGVQFNLKKGWILPLRLTPEIWTQLLCHRTQILYQPVISMILLQLDIKPNSVVVESGTGSGSLSHAILRACLPKGFLYTFEINETRFSEAQKEFQEHDFGSNVKVINRNVCENGFGSDLEAQADACVLDLPKTWEAIEHAHRVLKPDGSRLCTFSPCIEQVQQNVAKMEELEFKDIVTIECLTRTFELRQQKLRIWKDHILDGLNEMDCQRIESISKSLDNPKRAKYSDQGDKEPTILTADKVSEDDAKVEHNQGQLTKEEQMLKNALTDFRAPFNPNLLPKWSKTSAIPPKESTSHSGFLTFASKRP